MRTERANYKRREQPDKGTCGGRPPGLFGPRGHDWRYSSSWNGNNRRVLPWWRGTSGIGRSGWRCYHCGSMQWDESDEDYERRLAYALPGGVPLYARRLELGFINIPDNWFIYGMGERVSPTTYAGDTHIRLEPGFWVELQHRRGGLLTKGVGATMAAALQSAIDVLPLERAAEVYGDDA
jgi:hypothetical protein